MPITIGSNIASLKAQRQLSNGTAELSKTFERLSSGQRINRAADDAAGLAISESLKSDRRVFNQGVRNFNDGISLLNVADGAIEQLSNIVVRLKELAEQSANGTYGLQQRKAIDAEAQALSKEYLRISQSTKFNDRNLFNQSFGELRLQGGMGLDGGIQSGLGGAIGTGTFAADTSYSTQGALTTRLAAGDVNGDGIADIVSTGLDGSSNQAFVMLGSGNGEFSHVGSYQMGLGIGAAIQLGDMNGDGMLDMVSATHNSILAIRIGNGDGTFQAHRTYSIYGAGFGMINLADVNNDGNLDVVAGSDDGLTTFLGRGDGTLGASLTLDAGTRGMEAITLGDINGDGILDLVTNGDGGTPIAALTTWIGRGDGTFASPTTYTLDTFPASFGIHVELGDLDGDGKLDLIANTEGAAGRGYVSTFKGNGDGTFQTRVTYLIQGNSASLFGMKLGDINGDGFLDLVTGGEVAGDNFIAIQNGRGDGTFNAAFTYASSGTGIRGLVLGDLNGDGVLDVGSTNYSTGVNVLLSNTAAGVGPLLSFKLTSRADSLQALSMFDKKLKQLSQQRGTIGAFQSRINVGTNVLQASSENYAAAESRIRDVDIAQESSQLTRLNILQRAATSVLAQASVQPALALKLLNNN